MTWAEAPAPKDPADMTPEERTDEVLHLFRCFHHSKDGDEERALQLVEAGLLYDRHNEDKYGVLNQAALHNMAHVMEAMFARGASADESTDERFTALCNAALNGHLEAVRVLIEHGTALEDPAAKYNASPLVFAASSHVDVVRYLLEHGADKGPGFKNTGSRALHMAVYCRTDDQNLEIVRLLLEHGAPVLVADSDGKTPLDIARENKKEKIIELLEHYRMLALTKAMKLEEPLSLPPVLRPRNRKPAP